MSKPSFYVVGHDRQMNTMFYEAGYPYVGDMLQADMVIFIGGNDINPVFYGEDIGPRMSRGMVSASDDNRDRKAWWQTSKKQLKIGVCRGGQFLNVFNGGKLHQHVTGHHIDHKVFDTFIDPSRELQVTSSHHQMMIPTDQAEIFAYSEGISTEFWNGNGRTDAPKFEPEVVWYNESNCLCFQPHPEWKQQGNHTRNYLFEIIDKLGK